MVKRLSKKELNDLEKYDEEYESESDSEKYEKILQARIEKQKDLDDHTYPISKREALEIAYKDNRLKNDFYKTVEKNITYISFTSYDMDLEEHNNKKYWHIRIKSADMSWCKSEKCETKDLKFFTRLLLKLFPKFIDTEYTELYDGEANKEELEKMQCLVDVETGEYIYCG